MKIKKSLKNSIISRIKSNAGSVFAFTALLLTLLTTIGVVSVTKGSGRLILEDNYYRSKAAFYVAESGWAEGAMWIGNLTFPPTFNSDGNNTVKKYEETFPIVPSDYFSNINQEKKSSEIESIRYGYKIQYLNNKVAPGSGSNYRRFFYKISSHAEKNQKIDVKISKIFKSGY